MTIKHRVKFTKGQAARTKWATDIKTKMNIKTLNKECGSVFVKAGCIELDMSNKKNTIRLAVEQSSGNDATVFVLTRNSRIVHIEGCKEGLKSHFNTYLNGYNVSERVKVNKASVNEARVYHSIESDLLLNPSNNWEVWAWVIPVEKHIVTVFGLETEVIMSVYTAYTNGCIHKYKQLVNNVPCLCDGYSEEPDSEEPDSEEPDSEEPNSEEPNSEEPNSEEPNSEEPNSEEHCSCKFIMSRGPRKGELCGLVPKKGNKYYCSRHIKTKYALANPEPVVPEPEPVVPEPEPEPVVPEPVVPEPEPEPAVPEPVVPEPEPEPAVPEPEPETAVPEPDNTIRIKKKVLIIPKTRTDRRYRACWENEKYFIDTWGGHDDRFYYNSAREFVLVGDMRCVGEYNEEINEVIQLPDGFARQNNIPTISFNKKYFKPMCSYDDLFRLSGSKYVYRRFIAAIGKSFGDGPLVPVTYEDELATRTCGIPISDIRLDVWNKRTVPPKTLPYQNELGYSFCADPLDGPNIVVDIVRTQAEAVQLVKRQIGDRQPHECSPYLLANLTIAIERYEEAVKARTEYDNIDRRQFREITLIETPPPNQIEDFEDILNRIQFKRKEIEIVEEEEE
jgi:hypothetical protein